MTVRRILITGLIITLFACNSKKDNLINKTQWLIGTWEYKNESGNVSYPDFDGLQI